MNAHFNLGVNAAIVDKMSTWHRHRQLGSSYNKYAVSDGKTVNPLIIVAKPTDFDNNADLATYTKASLNIQVLHTSGSALATRHGARLGYRAINNFMDEISWAHIVDVHGGELLDRVSDDPMTEPEAAEIAARIASSIEESIKGKLAGRTRAEALSPILGVRITKRGARTTEAMPFGLIMNPSENTGLPAHEELSTFAEVADGLKTCPAFESEQKRRITNEITDRIFAFNDTNYSHCWTPKGPIAELVHIDTTFGPDSTAEFIRDPRYGTGNTQPFRVIPNTDDAENAIGYLPGDSPSTSAASSTADSFTVV